MEPVQLTATQFIKAMSAGRNRPLLLGCENNVRDTFEVVVKFRGREMNEKNQCAELICAQLADDLGLQVPQAAVVNVPAGFETIIPERELAQMVRSSASLNFGSLHVGPGFTTWPPGRDPHGVQRDQASEVFAFDALVQNPDRRAANPNLWVRSDRIGVFDHDQAFSFLAVPIIGGAPKPWSMVNHAKALRFLEQHIFYRSLRGGRLDLGPFKEKLGRLSDSQLQGYGDTVPAEWRNNGDFCEGIIEYLREARHERESLVNFIKHVLR